MKLWSYLILSLLISSYFILSYLILTHLILSYLSSGTVSDESRLITELVTRYKHRGILSRPINNNSEPIVINFQPWLMQILEFDVTAQVLTTLVWKYTVNILKCVLTIS